MCTMLCLLVVYADSSKFCEAVCISTFLSAFIYLGRIVHPSLYLSFNQYIYMVPYILKRKKKKRKKASRPSEAWTVKEVNLSHTKV